MASPISSSTWRSRARSNLPPGELISYLQRAGLAFGPDTNASTGFDQTIYQLDLPRNEPQLLGEGLGILSEMPAACCLAGGQIESERGVILSEKRVRDTPSQRSVEAMLDFLLPGSRYAEREPIGLEHGDPRPRHGSASGQFYRDWYSARAQHGRGHRGRAAGGSRAR